jgi:hypothetical protein
MSLSGPYMSLSGIGIRQLAHNWLFTSLILAVEWFGQIAHLKIEIQPCFWNSIVTATFRSTLR